MEERLKMNAGAASTNNENTVIEMRRSNRIKVFGINSIQIRAEHLLARSVETTIVSIDPSQLLCYLHIANCLVKRCQSRIALTRNADTKQSGAFSPIRKRLSQFEYSNS